MSVSITTANDDVRKIAEINPALPDAARLWSGTMGPRARLWSAVGRIALIVCAALAVAGTFFLLRQPDDPLAGLGRRVRAVEARLSVFDHASLSVKRSGQRSIDSGEVITALRALAKREKSGANLHRLALAELAGGSTRAALEHLEEAAALEPKSAAIFSDLAAAELALGEIADAAEHSAIAYELDPKLTAAAFNWALALERLWNVPASVAAWKTYLAADPDGGWADEARAHLARLEAPRRTWAEDRELLVPGVDEATIERLVRQYPQRARTRSQNILLPKWVASGNEGELAVLRSIARLRAAAGDPYLQDVIEHAVKNRETVAAGFRAYAEAWNAQSTPDQTDPAPLFAEAARLLQAAGSPQAIPAWILAATGPSVLQRLAEADRLLARNRYPALAADADWPRALDLARRGDHHEALAAYRRARASAAQVGETEVEVYMETLIASELESVDDPAEASKVRAEALRRLEEIDGNPNMRYVAYAEAALALLRDGKPRLARAFVESQASLAGKHPTLLAETELARALCLNDTGKSGEARKHIALARAHVPTAQTDFRDRTLSNVAYATGRIELATHPDRAMTAFGEAMKIWEGRKWWLHKARGHLARAECARRLRDAGAEERELRAGIAEMERQREALVVEPRLAIGYFERAGLLFERMIELLVEQGRTEEALSIAERKRARFLLDQLEPADAGKAAAPLDAKAIATAVDGSTAIVEMVLLERGAELWLIRDGSVVHERSMATRSEIEAAAARHLSAIGADDVNVVRREGRWLFDQLLAPVLRGVPPDTDLVIVADGVLQAFPFATLVQPDGTWLAERYAIATAPSASVFVHGAPRGSAQSVVAVAQPAPQGFDALPYAKAEADLVARRHGGKGALVGVDIGPAQFLRAAGGAGLVHFAGHATADARQSRSALVFESEGGEPLQLTASEIGQSRLRAHPLVVLAACSTARGKLRRNEGIDSLAAAFLQAGARGVVATLWDVDDGPSANLFRSFHAKLQGGARAADALRETQRALMNSTDRRDRSPAVWGSAVVVGTL